MNQELRDTYISLCKTKIHRDGIDRLLDWLENKTDFFTAPASTKFHGCYEGGLLEHSLNVYYQLGDFTHKFQVDVPEETIAIVALMHDFCKTNFYKKGFRNVKDATTGQWLKKETYEIDEEFPFGDHADKSIILIQHFMQLTPDEIYGIRAHMGGWDCAQKGGSRVVGNIFDKNKFAVLAHMADMAATYLMEERRES